ncbi:unnamed protein product [Ectocarpus sp. CCAP 1310/34]|nr:unnamed protein product [Ectocarpus sp. CCAP 1310/34]CAB1115978.1 unnamed protein product [Ectocarpus sp. CCAP 1310/34]
MFPVLGGVFQKFVVLSKHPKVSDFFPPPSLYLIDDHEHIACARRTLQAPSLSNTVRKLLSDSIEECEKRVTEIGFQQGGAGGLPDYFAYLPEAPATKPVTQLSTDAGVSIGASRAPAAEGALSSGGYAKVEEDEKKGTAH